MDLELDELREQLILSAQIGQSLLAQNNEYESKYALLQQEFDQLSEQLAEQTRKEAKLKLSLKRLEDERRVETELRDNILETSYKELEASLQTKNKTLKTALSDKSHLQKTCNDLTYQNQQLEKDNGLLRLQIQSTSSEFSKKVKKLEEEVLYLQTRFHQLGQTKESNEWQTELFDRHKEKGTDRELNNVTLEADKLHVEPIKIHGSSQSISTIKSSSTHLKESLDSEILRLKYELEKELSVTAAQRDKINTMEAENMELKDLVNDLQSKLSLSVEKSLLQSIHELRETLDNEVNRWSETDSKATQTASDQDFITPLDVEKAPVEVVKSLEDFKKWVPIALSAERLAVNRPLESANALTLIMKGSWMMKFTRRGNKHLRFVSVNPLERKLSWTRDGDEKKKSHMKSGITYLNLSR
jgi:hypothetical protein